MTDNNTALFGQIRAALGNEVASIVEALAEMPTIDRIFVNRIASREPDPYAIQYFANGYVEEHIERAHFYGPGTLAQGSKEQQDWLFLAALSGDESKSSLNNPRGRVNMLIQAKEDYLSTPPVARDVLIATAEVKIRTLSYTTEKIQGVEFRVYDTDYGFAAAYWSGVPYAAMRSSDGKIFMGTDNSVTLKDLGITPDVEISSFFGFMRAPEEAVAQ